MTSEHYLGIKSLVRKKCVERYNHILDTEEKINYPVDREINDLYMNLFRVCEQENCNYIMKVFHYPEYFKQRYLKYIGDVKNLDNSPSSNSILTEARILKYVSEKIPNLTSQYKKHWNCENAIYLVMKNIKGTTFRKFGNITLNHIIKFFSGVKSLHDNGIIHNDLNPDNIFIQPNGNIKIIDFGLSYIDENKNLNKQQKLSDHRKLLN